METTEKLAVARWAPTPNALPTLRWAGLLALVALGVAAVVLRLVFLTDAARQLEPVREAITGLASTDQRLAELADFDARFALRPVLTALHVVSGGAFLMLLPLQLSRALRSRSPALHRWNGRLLIVVGVLSTVTGLYFGIAAPFGGTAETAVIVPVALWFLTSLLRAYRAVRRREIDMHRRWMLRAIAAPLGVTVVRVVGPIADFTLTPLGASGRDVFVAAVCVGWALTFAVTEWFIRRLPGSNEELPV